MSEISDLILLAAMHMRVGGRRLRALARGDDGALREWIANESAGRLATVRKAARESYGLLKAAGAQIVTIADPGFPTALLDLRDPPAVCSVRGSFSPGGLAIIGSRTPSDDARDFAFELARCCGQTVVSGLALGIDAAAHRGALSGGHPTIAYLGCGIASIYPPEHDDLARAIAASGGAIASEFLPEQVVTRWSLVRRDRLQAAQAQATVLVSSEPDGGAMHTLRSARELGRNIFVLDPEVQGVQAGNRIAAARGAIVVPRDAERALRIIRERC